MPLESLGTLPSFSSGGAVEQENTVKYWRKKHPLESFPQAWEPRRLLSERKPKPLWAGTLRSGALARPCINLQPSSMRFHKNPKSLYFPKLTSFLNSQAIYKMTRLMISVLDERRDPDFEAYARGYPTRALPGPSKEKEYVMTSVYAATLIC